MYFDCRDKMRIKFFDLVAEYTTMTRNSRIVKNDYISRI